MPSSTVPKKPELSSGHDGEESLSLDPSRMGESSRQGAQPRSIQLFPSVRAYTPGLYSVDLPSTVHGSMHALPPRHVGRPSVPSHSTPVLQPSMALPYPTMLPPPPQGVRLPRSVMTVRSRPAASPSKLSLDQKADHAFSTLAYPSIRSDRPVPSSLDYRIRDAFSASYSKTKSPTFFVEKASDNDRAEVFLALGPCFQCASSGDECVLAPDDTLCTSCRSKYNSAKKSCSHKRIIHFRQFHLLAHLPPSVAFRLMNTLLPIDLRHGFQLTEEQWVMYRDCLRRLPFFRDRHQDLGLSWSPAPSPDPTRRGMKMDYVLAPPVSSSSKVSIHHAFTFEIKRPRSPSFESDMESMDIDLPLSPHPSPIAHSSLSIFEPAASEDEFDQSVGVAGHEVFVPSDALATVPTPPVEESFEAPEASLSLHPSALRHLREAEQSLLRIEGFPQFNENSLRSLAASIVEGSLKAAEEQLFDNSSSLVNPTLVLAPFSRELLDVYKREHALVLRQQGEIISNQERIHSQASQISRLEGVVGALSTDLRRVKDEFKSLKVKSGMHIISLTEEAEDLRVQNIGLQHEVVQLSSRARGDSEAVIANLRLQLAQESEARTRAQKELSFLQAREREVHEFATRFLAPPSAAPANTESPG